MKHKATRIFSDTTTNMNFYMKLKKCSKLKNVYKYIIIHHDSLEWNMPPDPTLKLNANKRNNVFMKAHSTSKEFKKSSNTMIHNPFQCSKHATLYCTNSNSLV
ncbi:hypothetical protein KFK09_001578 [Dendrobium nobile]|uniref:Uncharacterized protein n=1 Tax=Dendrobium nobile TaxID=94219 RepID=A0A8T3C5I5_DENNO|nr:hypothetical protein KFK09_001578 [Dendrobium nobile]